jgi:hypothetical protein
VIQAAGILIVSDNLAVIINFSYLGSDSARKSDGGKVAAYIKESKIRTRGLLVSNNVARIVDALQCRSSRARVINSRVSGAGFEKTLRWRSIVRSLVLTNYLPGIVDSASVSATAVGERHHNGGVSATG